MWSSRFLKIEYKYYVIIFVPWLYLYKSLHGINVTDTSRRASKSFFQTMKEKISDTIDDVQDFFDGDDDKDDDDDNEDKKEDKK